MKILVIDGQGGGVGKTLITFLRQSGIAAELMAAGTNAIATSNTVSYTHLAELMVEKDALQSMFLLGLSKTDLPFVFKGGTSLSKAYGLINRFSEDIDLSMNRKLMQSERKASKECIVEIAKSQGMELTNPDQIKSRYDYNRYVFHYDSLFSANHFLFHLRQQRLI